MINMNARPRLSIVDLRQATRHAVDYTADAEHRQLGDFKIQVRNVSARGFMVEGEIAFDPGERIQLRLPTIGEIEAYLVWRHGGRLGFQFERIIRPADFATLLLALNPKPISGKRKV